MDWQLPAVVGYVRIVSRYSHEYTLVCIQSDKLDSQHEPSRERFKRLSQANQP